MKEILETIILNMVDNKEAVVITETLEERKANYVVKIAEEDMGRIIGKQGKTAKAIRMVMKSVAGKEHKRINVEFVN
ncbi:MAG: KH domain-containing protein [Clostridia bacterium]|nr:KH domain-containing protein [Clostridia bacterium]MCI9413373.1 KH domain-containing protein [Clostridia bacterium]